jgi:hypothetical protein
VFEVGRLRYSIFRDGVRREVSQRSEMFSLVVRVDELDREPD